MAEEQQPQPVFTIEKIYVKDLSLEVPNAPQVFLEREAPRVDIQLSTEAKPIDDGHYDVTLIVGHHCPPDRFPGTIDRPVVPPVKASAYRCGEAWSTLVPSSSATMAMLA